MRDRHRARTATARLAALVLATLVFAYPPAVAEGEEVSGPELAARARRAAEDPAALDALRRVDRVDGRPVDLRRALDAPGPVAAQRARALANERLSEPTRPRDAPALRRDAGKILAEPRFHPRRAPRPFAGLLRRIGGWLRPIGEPVGRALGRLDGSWVGVVVAGVVVALAALVGFRVARRRTAANVETARSANRALRGDPGELERRADQAEQAGELERAYRLRFEAGLLRLDEAGRLRFRASLTTGEVLRQVPSAVLGELAGTLEEIVYGGRPAGRPDLDAARAGWPRVLEDVRR